MNNTITNPKSHEIYFKAYRVGSEWVREEPLRITQQQYEGLKSNSSPLVEINGELYSVSEINRVMKLEAPKRDVPQRWQFDSDEEYARVMEVFNSLN